MMRVSAMSGRLAVVAGTTTIFLIIGFILFTSAVPNYTFGRIKVHSEPVQGHAPYTGWPDPYPWHPPTPKDAASNGNVSPHLIVKVKLEHEDATWLEKLEPEWNSHMITIKDMFSNAHPRGHRPDKGRIANAYLTWIIENYHALPETTVFLPPYDSDAHHKGTTPEDEEINTPSALSSLLSALQTPFIQHSGYANLHCPTTKSLTTCNSKVLNPTLPPSSLRTLETQIPAVWESWFGNTTNVPERIASVLGGRFAVSRAAVQKRSVDEYVKFWAWLNSTIMDDDSAGLVCEWFWHVVFGKEAVFCPEREGCECDLYGRCDGV